MTGERLTYVLDTNVLVDYPGIIPGLFENQPEEPTIDLSAAHIVVPTAVIRELSSFKKEKSDRGKAARIVLRRIRELVEGKVDTLEHIYGLCAPILISDSEQIISVLPVHKDFKRCLPYSPSDDDMDGQIILATLATKFLLNGMNVDGGAERISVLSCPCDDSVILLTNDNGLAIRARERGIKTQRYGYKYPEPYTGRRDLIVPTDLFEEFYTLQRIERGLWEDFMPGQPKLVANEFIVMQLEDPNNYPRDYSPLHDPYFSNIGRYDAEEDAIVRLKHVRGFPVPLHNAGQAIYAEALADPNIAAVICTGPAGSGKTYMSTIYGYLACKNGIFIGVTVVPCEAKDRLGALPGDLNEKMDPEVQPLKNALRNWLLNEDPKFMKELANLRKYGVSDSKLSSFGEDDSPDKKSIRLRLENRVNLIWDNWFSNTPIERARGRDLAYEFAIFDEFQDQNESQADTLIKRIGHDGKIILTGDIMQIHAAYLDEKNNGLVYASRLLFDDPMVAQVCFTEDEVIRHPLVREIARRQKESRKK